MESGEFAGISVSRVGDVNGDGYDDIIIGASRADVPGTNSGEAYVVFGKPSFSSVLALSALNGTNGFRIDGINDFDSLGISVSDAGDVNGDGFDDLIIAANGGGPSDVGETYVVFGGNNSLVLNYSEVLNLSSTSNVLYVLRNNGDYVDIGTGWNQVSDYVESGLVFSAYVQGAAILRVQKVAATASVVDSHVYYANSTFANAGGVAAALDTFKVLAKEGATPQLLTYNNLINTSRGINGLVFDIAGLPANLTAGDFVFQMSPQGAFDEASHPEAGWTTAPATLSVSVLPGATARVVITWADHSIENRWLRVTIKANANTGLAAPEVY